MGGISCLLFLACLVGEFYLRVTVGQPHQDPPSSLLPFLGPTLVFERATRPATPT